MRRHPSVKLGAAAIAGAAGDRGGIKCVWQLSASESTGSCGWFSLQFSRSAFPTAWDIPVDLQKCIASLELLAQAALLTGRCVPGYKRHKVSLRQSSDNTPTEGGY